MRSTTIAATAAFASILLAAASAFAGESNFEPFPNTTQFESTRVGGSPSDTGSNGYPTPNSHYNIVGLNQATAPTVGSEGAVESANSLPRGFENGTVQFAEAQAANRWFAQQAQHRFALAHPGVTPRG